MVHTCDFLVKTNRYHIDSRILVSTSRRASTRTTIAIRVYAVNDTEVLFYAVRTPIATQFGRAS
jgi:hypothetical protein